MYQPTKVIKAKLSAIGFTKEDVKVSTWNTADNGFLVSVSFKCPVEKTVSLIPAMQEAGFSVEHKAVRGHEYVSVEAMKSSHPFFA
jgi:hypothetical protein